jgi:hypothetical protein
MVVSLGEAGVTPRYHFHFVNRELVCSDKARLNLPDDEAARAEANLTASDLRDIPGEDWSEWIIEVTDEWGRRVLALPVGPRGHVLQ